MIVFKPADLKCEFNFNPAGIDVENPNLSWTVENADVELRGLKQSAYQIIVSSSLENLNRDNGDLWNSGKVETSRMTQIGYSGESLKSSRKNWWKVKIWNQNNEESLWSENAFWITGLLKSNEWKAKWISVKGAEKYALSYKWAMKDFNKKEIFNEPQPNAPKNIDEKYSSLLIRREFEIQSELTLAVLHISGLGHYEVSLNGSKVGDYLLTPGWTNYRKTVLYDTYDVTQNIKSGSNTIGIILGNGMYNIQPDFERYVKFINTFGPLKAIAQLHLCYSDGSTEIVCSDGSWKVAPGPITFSNVFAGEDYDANLVPDGWDKNNFETGNKWTSAIETISPGGELKGLSSASVPIKEIETLVPVKINKLQNNRLIYDLGQNASVMPKIKVHGVKGSYVRMIPAELLNTDGTIDRHSVTQDGDGTLGEAEETVNLTRPAWWQYTLSGKKSENWFPKFFYHGSRYFQVELFPSDIDGELPVIDELFGIVVHASASPIGTFSCSNNLFNDIYKLVRWAQRSNMMSVLTDCPHRERLSWLEQYHLNGPSLKYNFDMTSIFRKGMNDMSDSQLENGFVPNISPEYFIAGSSELTNGFRNSPEWGSAFIIVPWQQYLFSGDTSLLKKHYHNMKRYVSFLSESAKNNIIHTGLGDWYDIGPKEPWGSQLTPEPLTATAIYYYDNWILARAAEILGKDDEAHTYDQLVAEIRDAFNKEFYNSEEGYYATNSQTANAIPLVLNIVEPENRMKVAGEIVKDIRKRGNAFTSGDVGYRFLLKALAMEGYSNVIYDMNNQSERPGYGYQLKMGATSLTEKWDASVGYLGSQNHFMLGQINEWFFNDLVGIGVDAEGAGFRKSIINLMMIDGIEWAKGSLRTVSGLIDVEWRNSDGNYFLKLLIPANTSAIIYIPTKEVGNVKEGGKQAGDSEGIKFLEMRNNKAVYQVDSGSYLFESKIE